MHRDQEHPREGQRNQLIIESLVELDELHHEPVIGTRNGAPLLDEALCLLVVEAVHEDQVGDDESDGPGDALDAVHQHILLAAVGRVDEVDDPIEQTLDVLVLGVLQEEGQVVILLLPVVIHTFEPVFAVAPGAVDDLTDVVILQTLLVFGHFLPRQEQALDYQRTVIAELLHFQFVSGCVPDVEFVIFLLLLHFLIGHVLVRLRLQGQFQHRRLYCLLRQLFQLGDYWGRLTKIAAVAVVVGSFIVVSSFIIVHSFIVVGLFFV